MPGLSEEGGPGGRRIRPPQHARRSLRHVEARNPRGEEEVDMYESKGIYEAKILVSKENDLAYLVEGDEELLKGMDGPVLEDNLFRSVPEKPGIYLCRVEFFFQQGYCDGYQADGESEWYYEIISAVPQKALSIEARLKELE